MSHTNRVQCKHRVGVVIRIQNFDLVERVANNWVKLKSFVVIDTGKCVSLWLRYVDRHNNIVEGLFTNDVCI